ncbi:MAG: hypothetical protein JXP73_02610 [Deltaproteobacteria bacterium]|nr:hypothetical protein [Deltaproteobacteria bacterium]
MLRSIHPCRKLARAIPSLFLLVDFGCGETSHPVVDANVADNAKEAIPSDNSIADHPDGERPDATIASDVPAESDGNAPDAAMSASDAREQSADGAPDAAAGTRDTFAGSETEASDIAKPASDASDTAVVVRDVAWGEAGVCMGETLSAAESASYFPLHVGARWFFRVNLMSNDLPTGTRLTQREVTGTKMFADVSAAVVYGPEPEMTTPAIEAYLELAPEGLIDHGTDTPPSFSNRPGRFAAPFTAVPFPIQTCIPYEPFNVPNIETADRDGDGLAESVAVHATTTLTFEDVAVPIGSFKKALRVETVETLVLTYTSDPSRAMSEVRHSIDWFASGVGPVKRYVERDKAESTSELIAYEIGDDRHGVVPAGWLARDADEASSNPYTPNRPSIGFDGQQFLVVIPTSIERGGGAAGGNLLAVVVDADGRPVRSSPLLDTGNYLTSVSMAWDGQRYLVAYINASYRRIEVITVSSAGETLSGPIMFQTEAGAPSVVATRDGFLVSYTTSTREPASSTTVGTLWLATVDEFGHATEHVQPYPGMDQRSASLAKDGAGNVMALLYTPPATPSPTLPETANILAAAHFAADGHAIDTIPFAVDAVPGVGHEEAELIFDGTNFVASWTQRRDSSTLDLHVVRITPDGELLDGEPTAGTSIAVSDGNNPRIARFGSGSLLVWGHRVGSDFFAEGIGGARFTVGGTLLTPPAAEDQQWLVGDYGAGWYSLPEILWGDDRALVVWRTPENDDQFDLACAVAYPW